VAKQIIPLKFSMVQIQKQTRIRKWSPW